MESRSAQLGDRVLAVWCRIVVFLAPGRVKGRSEGRKVSKAIQTLEGQFSAVSTPKVTI